MNVLLNMKQTNKQKTPPRPSRKEAQDVPLYLLPLAPAAPISATLFEEGFLHFYHEECSLSGMLQRLNILRAWILLTTQRHWETATCHLHHLLHGDVHTAYLPHSLTHLFTHCHVGLALGPLPDHSVSRPTGHSSVPIPPAIPLALGAFDHPAVLRISISEASWSQTLLLPLVFLADSSQSPL